MEASVAKAVTEVERFGEKNDNEIGPEEVGKLASLLGVGIELV